MALLQLVLLLGLQTPTLSVEGYVTDEESGAALHGARVELGRSAWAITDSLGHYELRADGAGTRSLRVTRLGYEIQTLEVILPSLGTLRVDIALRAAPALLPRVRVLALQLSHRDDRADLLAEPGVRRLTATQLREHPVLADADMLGAFAADYDVSFAPEAPASFHLRGGSSDQVRFLIDGVPFYSATHGSGVFGAINPDALDGVALHAGARSAAYGNALAGTVDAQSLRADSAVGSFRGGISTNAIRLTFAGPLVPGRSDLVLSGRAGKPALFAGRADRTRLSAAFNDWLVKSTTKVGSSTVSLLAAAAEDRTAFATRAESDTATTRPGRHSFDWSGMTIAAIWSAELPRGTTLKTSVWRANFDGDATWLAAVPIPMSSTRNTTGLQTTLVRQHSHAEFRAGLDVLRDRVNYSVSDSSGTAARNALGPAAASSVALFAEYLTRIARRFDARSGVRAFVLTSGSMYVEPRVSAAFHATSGITLSGGFARSYQTVQSLRNAESPAASVFAPDLPVLAHGAVPIGRADEGSFGMEVRTESVRLTLDSYLRRLTGLVVAQPDAGTPFAVGQPGFGDGRAWGVGTGVDVTGERLTARLGAALSGARVHITRSAAGTTLPYQPAFAVTRSLTAAAAYRKSESTTFRSAVFAQWGRRTTLFDGVLDWGGCDALDGGCEIAGSPGRSLGATSGVSLPPYVRWDVGARRSWTLQVAGRAVVFDGHATLRNLLDRRNVWGYSAQTAGAAPRSLLLRPVSLLTAGIDFRL